jgi:hypothetical protein
VNRLTQLKIALAVVGLAVWGVGARLDDAWIRVAGMVIVALAVVLRFLPARLKARIDGQEPPAHP